MTRRVKNVPTSTRKAVCLSTGELTWGCVGMELEEACGTRRTERVENQTNQQNKLENRLIRCILDAGEVILKSGGEINRVEDTMAPDVPGLWICADGCIYDHVLDCDYGVYGGRRDSDADTPDTRL